MVSEHDYLPLAILVRDASSIQLQEIVIVLLTLLVDLLLTLAQAKQTELPALLMGKVEFAAIKTVGFAIQPIVEAR
ncbi:MAG: hypothetical protein QW385_07610 [Thermoproteota archaeon]